MGIRRGGRKKGTPNKSTAEIKTLCMGLVPESMERLRQLVRNPDGQIAGRAIALVLSYAFGKPRETIAHVGLNDGPVRFTLSLGEPVASIPNERDSHLSS